MSPAMDCKVKTKNISVMRCQSNRWKRDDGIMHSLCQKMMLQLWGGAHSYFAGAWFVLIYWIERRVVYCPLFFEVPPH